MSDINAHIAEAPAAVAGGQGTVKDYFALLKPRVMSLVLFTGVAGLVLAPGHIHLATALTALLCIAVGAGASGALNMAYAADIDILMSRTRGRPVPQGRITAGEATAFGATMAVASITIMGLFVNELSAALLAFSLLLLAWLASRAPRRLEIANPCGKAGRITVEREHRAQAHRRCHASRPISNGSGSMPSTAR